MDDMTWDERIAAGTLIDLTDQANAVGFLWPVAVTEDLERWVQRTLPPRIGVPETLDRGKMEVLDAAMSAALMGVVIEAREQLAKKGAADPQATSFTFPYEAGWKADEVEVIRMAIVPGPWEQPAFVVGLASE